MPVVTVLALVRGAAEVEDLLFAAGVMGASLLLLEEGVEGVMGASLFLLEEGVEGVLDADDLLTGDNAGAADIRRADGVTVFSDSAVSDFLFFKGVPGLDTGLGTDLLVACEFSDVLFFR